MDLGELQHTVPPLSTDNWLEFLVMSGQFFMSDGLSGAAHPTVNLLETSVSTVSMGTSVLGNTPGDLQAIFPPGRHGELHGYIQPHRQPDAFQQIPQRLYRGNGTHFEARPPVDFELEPGVPIYAWHVLKQVADIPAAWYVEPAIRPGAVSEKIHIRINYPGSARFDKAINILNFKSPRQPISKAELLKRLCNAIEEMAEKNKRPASFVDDPWRIGQGGISFENIVIHSLEHVTLGTWQPRLSVCFLRL